MAAAKKETEIFVADVQRGEATFYLLGKTPLIMNRMSEKARRQLLLPPLPKNSAEKRSTLKHNPFREFTDAPYRLRSDDSPTLLGFPASAFKGAMSTAAIDLPGTAKAQIGRLVYVEAGGDSNLIPIFGEPQLLMSITRNAGMNKTPDVRTRVIIPRWAAVIKVGFTMPILKGTEIMKLLIAAGMTAGIGDWRPEKGKGDFGQFVVLGNEPDEEWSHIAGLWGRSAQEAAMADPVRFDLETESLLEWFGEEAVARGFDLNDVPDDDEEGEAA